MSKTEQTPDIVLTSERRAKAYRRFFGVALGFSLLLHVSLFLFYRIASNGEDEKTVQVRISNYDLIQPPIKFDVKAPRLTKSIESIKEATATNTFTPREFRLTPPTAAVNAPPSAAPVASSASAGNGRGGEGSVFYGALTGSGGAGGGADWSLPGGATSYGRSFGVGGKGGWGAGVGTDLGNGPDINTEVTTTRKASSGVSSLRENLIDYSNFQDRFEGFVVQNPKDKKKISGYLNFYQLEYNSSTTEMGSGDWAMIANQPSYNCVPAAIINLESFIRTKTQLDIKLKGKIRLDSRELKEVPILYMMGFRGKPKLSAEELKGLANYVRNGGFLFIDDGLAYNSGPFNKQMRTYLEQALGYDCVFDRLPNSHPLYHVWEDFAGPPPGEDEVRFDATYKDKQERYRYLEGITLNGRLAVLFSSKGYCMAWGSWPYGTVNKSDNTRQLQFGINAIVFACTQKGGIIDRNAQRLASDNK
jgi:hypothetical protein